jgi:hypothetical protein
MQYSTVDTYDDTSFDHKRFTPLLLLLLLLLLRLSDTVLALV